MGKTCVLLGGLDLGFYPGAVCSLQPSHCPPRVRYQLGRGGALFKAAGSHKGCLVLTWKPHGRQLTLISP